MLRTEPWVHGQALGRGIGSGQGKKQPDKQEPGQVARHKEERQTVPNPTGAVQGGQDNSPARKWCGGGAAATYSSQPKAWYGEGQGTWLLCPARRPPRTQVGKAAPNLEQGCSPPRAQRDVIPSPELSLTCTLRKPSAPPHTSPGTASYRGTQGSHGPSLPNFPKGKEKKQ